MKSNPAWLLIALLLSACGARSSLERWDEPSAAGSGGAGGSPGGGRAGNSSKGGGAPIMGGTFGVGGTFVSGGTFGEGGTGGAVAECSLAVADCASASEAACQGQRKPCAGELLAQFELDSEHGVEVADVATSRDGRVAVVGSFRGSLDIGGRLLESPRQGDQAYPTAAFVAVFDSNGKAEWAYGPPSQPEYQGTALRFAPNGDIVFQAVTYYDREPAALVVRLDKQGKLIWQKSWGAAGHITPTRLGIDNDGRIWLSGFFRGTFDFPGTSLDAGLESSGYLLELNADGEPLSAFGVRQPDWQWSTISGMAVDDEDNVLVVGQSQLAKAQTAVFLEKFSSDGESLYLKTFTGSLDRVGVTVDRMMRPTLFGDFTGSFRNEGVQLDAERGLRNLWLSQYSRDGALIWQQTFKGHVTATSGTSDPFDNIIVAGTGPLVIDGTALASNHAAELGTTQLGYVMKLRPDGNPVWGRAFDGAITGNALATDNAGFIWIASQFQQQVWVDNSTFSTASTAGLLLELSP